MGSEEEHIRVYLKIENVDAAFYTEMPIGSFLANEDTYSMQVIATLGAALDRIEKEEGYA